MSQTQQKLRVAESLNSDVVTKPVNNFLELPGCEFTTTGLKISPGLRFEHWERIGEVLKKAESGIQWWIGDWMNYGEKSYGEKSSQANDIHDETGINVDTIRNYQWVAEQVKLVRRLTTLPWSHHQAVAALPPKEQSTWLNKAKEEGLSYRELKREVEKSERSKNFKLVNAILEKIFERIQDGCYTIEAIMKCSECGNDIFHLDAEEIKLYCQQLVGSGRVESRKQGGKTDQARGEATTLYVPVGTPAGNEFDMGGYRPQVDYGDDEEQL